MINNSIFVFCIVLMTFCAALGAVLLKKASYEEKKINKYLLTGLGFYGFSAILNIYLLKFLPYTIVFPSGALNYIWAMIMAKLVFKEHIGKLKILGIVFISTGIILLT